MDSEKDVEGHTMSGIRVETEGMRQIEKDKAAWPLTDRSLSVLKVAESWSYRLNHRYVNSLHVLYGLANDVSGVAGHVLNEAGITTDRIADQSRELFPRYAGEAAKDGCGAAGYSESFKKCMDSAIAHMKKSGNTVVGTEHILLGILEDRESIAVHAIANMQRERSLDGLSDKIWRLLGEDDEEQKIPPMKHDDWWKNMLRMLEKAKEDQLLRTDMAYDVYTTIPGLGENGKLKHVYFVRASSEGMYFRDANKIVLISGPFVVKQVM